MRRIETRDLYHCSTKIRIPKTFKLSSPCDSSNGSGKESNGENTFWKALMKHSKVPEGVPISEFLASLNKKEDEKEYLWIPIKEHLWIPVSAHLNNFITV